MSGEPTTTVTPAVAPAAAAPAAAAPAVAAPAAWHTSFQGDDKGWLENRGLHTKDLPTAAAELVKTARNAEAKYGLPTERVLKLPEKIEIGMLGEVYDRLGRPAKPEEYKLPGVKGADGKEQPMDEGFTKWAQGTFHKAGLSQAQAEAVLASWQNDYVAPNMKADAESHKTLMANETAELQKVWGSAFDQNQKIARKTAEALGVTEEQFDAIAAELGPKSAMFLFHKLGTKVMEPEFINGLNRETASIIRSPEAAKQRIRELEADQNWKKKYMAGDTEARAEFSRLHREANPPKTAA